MVSSKKLFFVLIAVIVIILAVGCSKDSEDRSSVTGPEPGKSKVRVLHTSYDAPNVDIRIDGTVAISNLAYGESSGYADVAVGSRNIQVTPSGQSSPVVIDRNLTIEDNKEYTIIAVDKLSSIEALVVEDLQSVNSTNAKVRFLHSAPDAPNVDIKLISGIGPTLFSNAAFKEITPYVEVDASSYSLAVTATGSTDEVVVFDPITVENGKVYTVIAHGTLDPSDSFPFAVRVFIDNESGSTFADLTIAETVELLVTHASPDAPSVDLLIDNIVINSLPLSFPNNTGYFTFSDGIHNVKVNAAGSSTTVINADLPFTANTNYSIFAADFLNNIEAVVITDDLAVPAAGNSHVRFVHLSPDAPAVNITDTQGNIIFGNIAFKGSTTFSPLPSGTYDLEVRDAATNSTTVLTLSGVQLNDEKIYTVFAKGSLNDQTLGAEIIVNN